MAMICTICRENLDTSGEGPPGYSDGRVCSTRCGHIFHTRCINRWFVTQLPPLVRNGSSQEISTVARFLPFPCPICAQVSTGPFVLTLFPSFTGVTELSMRERFAAVEAKMARLETELLALQGRLGALKDDYTRLTASAGPRQGRMEVPENPGSSDRRRSQRLAGKRRPRTH